MLRGIFLDLDGTLADSLPLLRGVYQEFMTGLGLTPREDEFGWLAGLTFQGVLEHLRTRYHLTQTNEEIAAAFQEIMRRSYHRLVRLAPGGRELCQAAREHGLHLAVVTSASRRITGRFLALHGLDLLVDQVVASEDVGRSKPHPEPYLKALATAGLSPAEGLAVEDSPPGVMSALAAGLPTFVIAHPGAPPTRQEGVAGYISRLDEIIDRL
ncbi:MAG: HAD family phosphatase [Deltaproteobacteria bacterium]|nr:HAD family phosphatase [Deltaproteobacteria bacterium]